MQSLMPNIAEWKIDLSYDQEVFFQSPKDGFAHTKLYSEPQYEMDERA